jgi:hypothetical protein
MDYEDGDIVAEGKAGGSDADSIKLVPVSESIRYRKRAQSAEKQNEQLLEQLEQSRSQARDLSERINEMETERKLTSKLAQAGAIDVEAAVLLAKARLGSGQGEDIDGVVDGLCKEKGYLFGSAQVISSGSQKTSGVRDKRAGAEALLSRAAKRAAQSGDRIDIAEYMKLRRNFL